MYLLNTYTPYFVLASASLDTHPPGHLAPGLRLPYLPLTLPLTQLFPLFP